MFAISGRNARLLVHSNGADNIYGKDVIWRNSSADLNQPFTSWINTINTLISGTLKKFHLFIERRNTDPSLKKLQIWRHVSEFDYMLIWERIANFSATYSHALYEVGL